MAWANTVDVASAVQVMLFVLLENSQVVILDLNPASNGFEDLSRESAKCSEVCWRLQGLEMSITKGKYHITLSTICIVCHCIQYIGNVLTLHDLSHL